MRSITMPRLRVLPILLIASTCLNILLEKRVADLNGLVQHLKSDGTLRAGSKVSDFSAFDIQRGSTTRVACTGTDQPTILYVFSPTCKWCSRNLRNLENIRAVSAQTRGRYRLIGLSLSQDGLSDYVRTANLDFPIYSQLDPNTVIVYKLGATPQTIVVSPGGTVTNVWKGAYVDDVQAEVERVLSVRLPGLAAVVASVSTQPGGTHRSSAPLSRGREVAS